MLINSVLLEFLTGDITLTSASLCEHFTCTERSTNHNGETEAKRFSDTGLAGQFRVKRICATHEGRGKQGPVICVLRASSHRQNPKGPCRLKH